MSAAPSLRIERRLLREGRAAVACVDEVGRGALSGPVTVGMVLVTPQTRTAPRGVRDSKLLTPQARRDLVPRIERWAAAHAVGHATAAEIDRYGIITAMRLAGHRAVALLSPRPDLLLLDGNHDYLTDPDQGALFAPDGLVDDLPPVMTMVKADLRCAAVAAASILAKTTRDAIMVDLAAEHPEYGWDVNKGYASPDHIAALAEHGPTVHHRRSWRLPGCDRPAVDVATMAGTSSAEVMTR